MSVNDLLSRVKGLRETSKATWMCLCPSHVDKTRSLSIRLAEDGRVLVNCFAGCSASDIVSSVGLGLEDLWEQPLYHRAKPIRGTRVFPRDVLIGVKSELMIVALTSFDLKKGKALSDEDQARLGLAYERITDAIELAGIE